MKINSVKIKNFKSLKDVDIKLNNLTLITGVNSSGKSSFIQSLLLFRENRENIVIEYLKNIHGELPADLGVPASFNGKYIKLGKESLLLSQNASTNDMVFKLDTQLGDINISINKEQKINLSSDLDELDANKSPMSIFFDVCFHYLSTDRVPPDYTFGFSKQEINLDSIGINGDYTAHYLAENRHRSLEIEPLKHPASQTLQLLENTYKWLGEISNGISISASADASTQSAKLTYQYEYGDNTTSQYSPLNVGFGLTYVLPVVVLILKSKPGDFIIIENPESHLHPAGQSKIAEMCAIAANNGVQIIIETHSDHFLNGVRVATKKGVITPDKSQIYFFEKEENGLETIPHPINIDKYGNLDDYPESFFDEWDNNLDRLLDL